MNKFIMLVGFPGAGKSTFSSELAKKNYHVHSTDSIREEFGMHKPEQIDIILGIIRERIKMSSECHANIVFDSTNLSRKRRIEILNLPCLFNYNKICVIVDTPLEICKERNSYRTGYAKISEDDFKILEKVYRKPIYKEGWDYIFTIKGDKQC